MHFFLPEVAVGAVILLCLCSHWGRVKSASPFWKINNPQTQLDYFYPANMISSPAMCCNMFTMTVVLPAIQTEWFPGRAEHRPSLQGEIFETVYHLLILGFVFTSRGLGENWRARSDKFLVDNRNYPPVLTHYGVWQWALQNGTFFFCFNKDT